MPETNRQPPASTPRSGPPRWPGRDPLPGQLAERDPAALAVIQARHGAALRRYLDRMLGDTELAAEVMQQVLLEAWLRGPRYDPERASLLTWLLTMARSRAIDVMRRRVPEPRDPTATVALADRAAVAGDHADELADRAEVSQLLAGLSPTQASLLRMRFQLGLSQREIAAFTGTPLGTVKRRMGRALELLREEATPAG